MVLVNNTNIKKLTLTTCSASHQQRNWPCLNVLKAAGGWAFDGKVPAWTSVELITPAEVSRVTIASAVGRNDGHHPTLIKLELKVGNDWVLPKWPEIDIAAASYNQQTGQFSLPDKTKYVQIKFDPTKGVTKVKLHVYKSDIKSNNAVVNEIQVLGSLPVDGYHFKEPTTFG